LAANGTALTWTDNSSTEYKYMVYTVNTTTGANSKLQDLLANAAAATLTTAPTAANTVAVIAEGANGKSGALLITPAALGVPTISGSVFTTGATANARNATFTYVDMSTTEKTFVPQYSTDGGLTWTSLASKTSTSVGTTGTSYTSASFRWVPGTTYQLRVVARGVNTVVAGVDLTATATSLVTTVVK
jgi:hypothetical protein